MRRSALLCLVVAAPSFLAGCTGTGVFFDHTFSFFGANPNTPAGNSEMMQRLRGEPVPIQPLLPEAGNVWPGPQQPDPTLQEIEREQGNGPRPDYGGGTDHQQPHAPGFVPPNRPAPAVVTPGSAPSNLVTPPRAGAGGTELDVTGGSKNGGYRHLQSPPAAGRNILVPNGNGTSTMIGPDGSISTVPTKP